MGSFHDKEIVNRFWKEIYQGTFISITQLNCEYKRISHVMRRKRAKTELMKIQMPKRISLDRDMVWLSSSSSSICKQKESSLSRIDGSDLQKCKELNCF
jgi:hypothetical protein